MNKLRARLKGEITKIFIRVFLHHPLGQTGAHLPTLFFFFVLALFYPSCVPFFYTNHPISTPRLAAFCSLLPPFDILLFPVVLLHFAITRFFAAFRFCNYFNFPFLSATNFPFSSLPHLYYSGFSPRQHFSPYSFSSRLMAPALSPASYSQPYS